FGNVSIEAQAMGVPVITFDVTGARDTLVSEQTGLITRRKNTEGLTEAIRFLIDNLELTDKMSNDSRRFVAANFDRVLMQNELVKFYKSLDIQRNVKKEVKQALHIK